MQEVHHPHEDVDFGSYGDEHRHRYPSDDWHHPREAADRTFHFVDRHYDMQNSAKPLKEMNKAKDNEL